MSNDTQPTPGDNAAGMLSTGNFRYVALGLGYALIVLLVASFDPDMTQETFKTMLAAGEGLIGVNLVARNVKRGMASRG